MRSPRRSGTAAATWIDSELTSAAIPDALAGTPLPVSPDLKAEFTARYEFPLGEIITDFHDKLKSSTSGYASFDYQISEYREDNLVKMSILVNDEPVDALSMMVHRDRAEARGRSMVEKLKDLIPRHMFKIPIQAAIGGRVTGNATQWTTLRDNETCVG